MLETSLFTDLIEKEFLLSNKTYGSPKTTQQLKRMGYSISQRRVAKIMRSNRWISKLTKKFKITTNSNHSYPVCRNLLNRKFSPKELNEVWVSDITYIKTTKGWLYLRFI